MTYCYLTGGKFTLIPNPLLPEMSKSVKAITSDVFLTLCHFNYFGSGTCMLNETHGFYCDIFFLFAGHFATKKSPLGLMLSVRVSVSATRYTHNNVGNSVYESFFATVKVVCGHPSIL